MTNPSEAASGPPPWVRWLVWVGYLLTWTWALLTQRPKLPPWIPQPEWGLFLFSKAVHVGGYAALAVLSGWLRAPLKFRWLLLVFVLANGFVTEFFQSLLPTGRTGSWRDVGIDLVGVALGLLVSRKWWREPAPASDAGGGRL